MLKVCQFDYYTGQETQVWLDYTLECGYIKNDVHASLNDKYDHILAMIVKMSTDPGDWSF